VEKSVGVKGKVNIWKLVLGNKENVAFQEIINFFR